MKTVILDVDTGNDDAVAIMMAGLSPEIDLIACTCVGGNLPVSLTTDNTLRVVNHIGRKDIPVFRGLGKAIAPPPFPLQCDVGLFETSYHQEILPLAPSPQAAQPLGAVEWLVGTLRGRAQDITLIATGPLTNIAAALTLEPRIVEAVEQLIIMGGSATTGNSTSQAEFNIFADPIAAHIVFQAGFSNLALVPLDATRKAIITSTDTKTLANCGTPAARACAHILDYYIEGDGGDMCEVHDALCVAYAIDPSIVKMAPASLSCDTVGFHTYGRTIIDRDAESSLCNALVGYDADSAAFAALLHNIVGTEPVGSAK